ncbi:MAG: hypothetical protein COV01_00910 [Candidatus Taylorbacteria bacterium CG10_big_fil_rev_8_21_14_0_10_41_48]|uniref:Uncharacterized protein n=1 Tax=Candidatus Taylorbacteria bacterium CG10_big_fil_rev_8_21_14_0_10_41_48 TaxID=1975024 RepID=A0A2M8LD88_9BACT|nr:MAG: hypothetical protein COV01_00910 [Candidatus Taylorbacteria bacterium CG10_big_fil_rev_8_21_14_0_10_41_48]
MKTERRKRFLKDLFIIAISIVVAVYIGDGALLANIFGLASGHIVLSAIIGGLFFTSVFTTIPAVVFLGKLALIGDPVVIAIAGGIGAVIGDLIIFRFIRDHLTADLKSLLSENAKIHLSHVFEFRFFRWFMAMLGAIVISSPLPDEIGLAMMGMTKMRTIVFVPISFICNSLGILMFVYAAQGLFN